MLLEDVLGLCLDKPPDKKVQHRFRRPFDLRLRYAPAREMAVDMHPRKAVDQGTGGDFGSVEIKLAELASCGGLGQEVAGECNQFGIVTRDLGRTVMVEMGARGEDGEMRGFAHCPGQIA